jgi:predicted nucleic acid-binding protein
MDSEIKMSYQVLELDETATADDVKRAWRQLAKVWHPDRFPNDAKLQQRGQEKQKTLNAAYKLLSDYLASPPPPKLRSQPSQNHQPHARPQPPKPSAAESDFQQDSKLELLKATIKREIEKEFAQNPATRAAYILSFNLTSATPNLYKGFLAVSINGKSETLTINVWGDGEERIQWERERLSIEKPKQANPRQPNEYGDSVRRRGNEFAAKLSVFRKSFGVIIGFLIFFGILAIIVGNAYHSQQVTYKQERESLNEARIQEERANDMAEERELKENKQKAMVNKQIAIENKMVSDVKVAGYKIYGNKIESYAIINSTNDEYIACFKMAQSYNYSVKITDDSYVTNDYSGNPFTNGDMDYPKTIITNQKVYVTELTSLQNGDAYSFDQYAEPISANLKYLIEEELLKSGHKYSVLSGNLIPNDKRSDTAIVKAETLADFRHSFTFDGQNIHFSTNATIEH